MGSAACSCGQANSERQFCCTEVDEDGREDVASRPCGEEAVDDTDFENGPLSPVKSARTSMQLNSGGHGSDQTDAGISGLSQQLDEKSAALLEEIQRLVDVEYDIIGAAMQMQHLEAKLAGTSSWLSVQASDLHQKLTSRLKFFWKAGKACFDESGDWFCIYDNAHEGQSIHACFDAKDSTLVHYRVRAQINAPLSSAMAVGNEVQLMQNWNKLCESEPKTFGNRTAHHMVLNYQMSALAGFYKLDILNEIRRFTDPEGGFLAEYVASVDKGHPCYREPSRGYSRPQTELQSVWSACGPEHTMLIQAGKVKLPFSIGKWLGSKLGGLAGKFLVGGFVQNALRAAEPNSPWQPLLQADALGLYARLKRCEKSARSQSRQPKPGMEGAKIALVDVLDQFQEKRFSSLQTAPVGALLDHREKDAPAADAQLRDLGLKNEDTLAIGGFHGSFAPELPAGEPQKRTSCCCRRRKAKPDVSFQSAAAQIV